MSPRKNAPKTRRGRPFEPGNPGRPRGSRHKITLAAEALLDGEGEALTRKAIELALADDTTALRLCLERLIPPRRDRPINLDLGQLNGLGNVLDAMVKVIAAMARGDITPSEATAVMAVVEVYRRTCETADLEARLVALESRS